MGDYGRVWWSSDDALVPPIEQWRPIEDCYEWDGMFSITASNGSRRLFVTAFCDNVQVGSFKIKENGKTIEIGTTRVSLAPTLVEDDGYPFPAGTYFGAGKWEVECETSSGQSFLVIADVRDWKSID